MAKGTLVKFSPKANKVFKILKENDMKARAFVAAIVGFAVGISQTANAEAVFETMMDDTNVYTFGSPVGSGEIAKANIGSAEEYAVGRFAFRSGTVNVKEGGYARMIGDDTNVQNDQVKWGNWLGANGCSATLNINGGVFWACNGAANANTTSEPGRGRLRIGVNDALAGRTGVARLNLISGELRIDNVLMCGGSQYNADNAKRYPAEMNMSGGTAVINNFWLGARVSGNYSTAAFNLTGGEMQVNSFVFQPYHNQTFTWGSGTIIAKAANVFSAQASQGGCTRTVSVTGNPAVFDTGNFAQTIPAAIANGTGTLKLTGGNTVTLSAAPSFGLWLDGGTTLAPAGGSLSVPASGTFVFSGDATVNGSLVLGNGAGIVCHVGDSLSHTAGTLTATGGFTLPQGVESVLDLVTVTGGAAAYEKSLSADGKTITVSKSGGSVLTWNGGTAANWGDLGAWTSSGAAADWSDGSQALFATADATVTLGNDVSAESISFNADTTLTGMSTLAAPVVHVAPGVSATVAAHTSGALKKTGEGTLALGSSRTAATTLSEGTLVMGDGTSLDWSKFFFGTEAAKPVTLRMKPTATFANLPVGDTWVFGSVANVTCTMYKEGGEWDLPQGTHLAVGRAKGSSVSFYHAGGSLTTRDFFAIGSGTSANDYPDSVYFEISGGAVRNVANSYRMYIGGVADATVVVTNDGALAVTSDLKFGMQNGSTGNLTVYDRGTVYVGGVLDLGVSTGSCGNVTVYDRGNVNVRGNIFMGVDEGSSGNLTIHGGEVAAAQVLFSITAPTRGIVNLKGGVLSTIRLYRLTDGTAELNFDGGTLKKASEDGNVFPANGVTSVIDVTLGTNGGTIDNNGLAIRIPRTITGVGGLALTGSGKTTVSADQFYTGPTTVGSNTTLSVSGCTFTGAVCFEKGAAFDIAPDSADVVPFSAASVSFPADGTIPLTLNGGQFPLGSYKICSANGMTPEIAKAGFSPARLRKYSAIWRVVDGQLILDVRRKGVCIIVR